MTATDAVDDSPHPVDDEPLNVDRNPPSVDRANSYIL
jgi:hypothetical protein